MSENRYTSRVMMENFEKRRAKERPRNKWMDKISNHLEERGMKN